MRFPTLENRVYEIDFKDELTSRVAQTDAMLRSILDEQTAVPKRLAEAMEYVLLSPGKRIRAALVQWVCNLVCGQIRDEALVAGAAIEMVHTYSLVHDDLPAMDDDDMRRGRPSCHKQFDEATAILTGDALLTLGFEVTAGRIVDAAMAVQMIRILAQAAGAAGMIAGQMADLEAEQTEGTLDTLRYIHVHKTAKMFAGAAGLGAVAGGALPEQTQKLQEYGLKIGLGFQIADDLLDVSATSEQLGKTAGKDAAQGKLTYPALVGMEQAEAMAEQLTQEALDCLEPFGPEADLLRRLALELFRRKK